MKNSTIRKKLVKLLMGLAVLLVAILIAVELVSLYVVRGEIETRSDELGTTVSNETSQAILNKTIDQMMAVSNDVTSYSNERFYQIESQAKVVAAALESIYANKQGTYSTQILSPYGLLTQAAYDANVAESPRPAILHIKAESKAWDSATSSLTPAAQAELNLISPIGPTLVESVAVNDILTACYVGTTAGVQLSADSATTQSSVMSTNFGGDGGMASRGWFQTGAALADGETAWTTIFQDVSGRGASLTCVTPIYDGTGTLRGVLVCASTMAGYSAKITGTSVGESGRSFIVNSDGDIIISAEDITFVDGQPQYKKLSDSGDDAIKAAEDKIKAGGTGYVIGEYEGKQVLLTYEKIASQPWSFVTLIDMSEVTASSNQIAKSITEHTSSVSTALVSTIRTTVLVMLAVVIASLLLVLYLSNRFATNLTRPLLALTEGANAIGSGKLDTVIQVDSDDETKVLADAFNGMTSDLKDHIADLKRVTAEKERIGAELGVATKIQASMLPSIFPPFPDRDEFDIYASMTPAKEVGGDFYDFFLVDDDHLALVMADVSGKGVPAALFMVIAKTLLKNSAQAGLGVAEVLEKVNKQLCENNEADMFVTVWMGIMQISTGKMICASAGHEYPTIRRKGGDFELIHDKHGFVLAGIEFSTYTEYELHLGPGDTLFVYTDGVPEATSAENELFGTDRMIAALNQEPGASPARILPELKASIDEFVEEAPQFDDITMLALEMRDDETSTGPATDATIEEPAGTDTNQPIDQEKA